jgi:ABC-2 type transport system ATP-binding protein
VEKRNWLASKLSGGMQRRLNICLALIQDPEIIIFDEPEAGLDPQSRAYIRDYIKNLSGNKTIVLTTHNMDEAERLATQTAIIDHGKLLIQGSNHELIQNTGALEILEIQLPGTNEIPDSLSNKLNRICDSYELLNSFLIIKSENISSRIETIISLLESEKLNYKDMKIRESSLEDVFLKLTGRSLRA